MNEWSKKYKAYVLIDPITLIPRYVGVTRRKIRTRYLGHLYDVKHRPDLNKHKTAWINKLHKGGLLSIIKQIAEFDSEEQMLEFEKDYILKYKDKYKLINQTIGGEAVGFHAHSRENILKKTSTRPIVQYNILGEKINEFPMTEDARRTLGLKSNKACSHITACCKGDRKHAYGYIWRYKGQPLGDITDINPNSLCFNILVQFDSSGCKVAEFTSYSEASKAIDDHSKGGNIAGVINGHQKFCKGYTFKLIPNYTYFDKSLLSIKKQIWKEKEAKSVKYRKIFQYSLDGQFLKEYTSLSDAASFGYGNRNYRKEIKECCTNKRSSFKNYKWSYKGPQ